MLSEAVNQVYNLEGPRRVSVLEVAERIRSLVGSGIEIEFSPSGPATSGRQVSSEKAERELGWRPEIEFEDGLLETVAWFRKRWGL